MQKQLPLLVISQESHVIVFQLSKKSIHEKEKRKDRKLVVEMLIGVLGLFRKETNLCRTFFVFKKHYFNQLIRLIYQICAIKRGKLTQLPAAAHL